MRGSAIVMLAGSLSWLAHRADAESVVDESALAALRADRMSAPATLTARHRCSGLEAAGRPRAEPYRRGTSPRRI